MFVKSQLGVVISCKSLKAYEVEADNVVIFFSSLELDGEALRVARLIRELSAEGDGREPDKGCCLSPTEDKKSAFCKESRCY